MPILPSGRRVEFSLDRFHAMLDGLPAQQATAIANALNSADDLLFVMDAVHFRSDDGFPYFASYVAAAWRHYAADWTTADRQALDAWFGSEGAMEARAEAIRYIRECLGGQSIDPTEYPYIFSAEPVSARSAGRPALH
jgi:hypothetical protein